MYLNVYVGIDPSFRRTGVSIYYPDERRFITASNPYTPLKEKTYPNIVVDVNNISYVVTEYICRRALLEDTNNANKMYIRSECPPPQGISSPMLYALDVALHSRLIPIAEEVSTIYPTTICHIHQKKKFAKSESVDLANKILVYLISRGYQWEHFYDLYGNTKSRINNDEAESFIFLINLLLCKKVFASEDEEALLKINQYLSYDKSNVIHLGGKT